VSERVEVNPCIVTVLDTD